MELIISYSTSFKNYYMLGSYIWFTANGKQNQSIALLRTERDRHAAFIWYAYTWKLNMATAWKPNDTGLAK